MRNGWPPSVENTPAAIAEESKTSATPDLPVVSVRFKEAAIPGRTLRRATLILPLDRGITVLDKENGGSGWYYPIVPGVSPIASVVRDRRPNIDPNTGPDPKGLDVPQGLDPAPSGDSIVGDWCH